MSTKDSQPAFFHCVTRDFGTGFLIYVPVGEAHNLETTDIVYSGWFNCCEAKFGPSRSHRVTECLPVDAQKLERRTYHEFIGETPRT